MQMQSDNRKPRHCKVRLAKMRLERLKSRIIASYSVLLWTVVVGALGIVFWNFNFTDRLSDYQDIEVKLKIAEIGLIVWSIGFAYIHLQFLKKQASTSIILDIEKDKCLRESKRKIRENLTNYLRCPLKIYENYKHEVRVKIFSEHHKTMSIDEVMNVVRPCIDHYEAVATAIECKTIDEELFQKFNLSSYVKTWNCLNDLVIRYRKEKSWEFAYENFENLATKWKPIFETKVRERKQKERNQNLTLKTATDAAAGG